MKLNPLEIQKAQSIIEKFKKRKSKEEIFYNLCFCICVPQARFISVTKVIKRLKLNDFYHKEIPYEELVLLIKETRFKKPKALYLLEMKPKLQNVIKILSSKKTSQEKRKEIIKEIKGLGNKAASHFLRNMGIENLAIIDVHIKKYLKNKKDDYLELEKKMIKKAKFYGYSVAVLDAYLWKNYSGINWKDFNY